MMKEMQQLHDKKAFHPVKYINLDGRQRSKIIRSHMFLKQKRDGKLKLRLVANGSMQERSTSTYVSSPTVSTEALLITIAIEAYERRKVVHVDIDGAYIHADMEGEVIVDLDPVIAAILMQVDAKYDKYVGPDTGKLFVILDKALYGCIESARLFYFLSTYF
jgi:hypothetical protein